LHAADRAGARLVERAGDPPAVPASERHRVIPPDEDPAPGGRPPDNPLHALLAAALIVAIALLGISIVEHERSLDVQRLMLRDPAIHRYDRSTAVHTSPAEASDESDCPEVEVQLLC
jgi:hypothetical protein